MGQKLQVKCKKLIKNYSSPGDFLFSCTFLRNDARDSFDPRRILWKFSGKTLRVKKQTNRGNERNKKKENIGATNIVHGLGEISQKMTSLLSDCSYVSLSKKCGPDQRKLREMPVSLLFRWRISESFYHRITSPQVPSSRKFHPTSSHWSATCISAAGIEKFMQQFKKYTLQLFSEKGLYRLSPKDRFPTNGKEQPALTWSSGMRFWRAWKTTRGQPKVFLRWKVLWVYINYPVVNKRFCDKWNKLADRKKC